MTKFDTGVLTDEWNANTEFQVSQQKKEYTPVYLYLCMCPHGLQQLWKLTPPIHDTKRSCPKHFPHAVEDRLA